MALLSSKTFGGAAKRCGLNERTLRRWMEDEEFKAELAEARRVIFEGGMSRLQALMSQAVETLAALMAGGMPPSVRLGAARTVAELAISRYDADTIVKRVDEIEAYQRQCDATGGRR